MRSLILLILLITTPSFFLFPHENISYDKKTPSEPLSSYDKIIKLLNDLESGKLEKQCSLLQLNKIDHMLARFAKKGTLSDDACTHIDLESDIVALLNEDLSHFAFDDGEYSILPATLYDQSEIILCGVWSKNWKKTKKFFKKHKKEIIIGAAIVVATSVVVVAAVATTTCVGAGIAAGAAGAAAGLESDTKTNSQEPPQITFEDTYLTIDEPKNAPILEAAIHENTSAFKEFACEDVIYQSCDALQDLTFSEKARNIGSLLAHETLDGISEIASCIPELGEELKEIGERILPKHLLPGEIQPGNPKENYEKLVAGSHQIIDKAFSTNNAGQYTPEAKASDPLNDFAVGVLPPPGTISKGLSISKFREIIAAGKETAVLAEELGFTAKQIAELEKTGRLEKSVTNALDKIYSNKVKLESVQRHQYAREYLEPFSGKYLPEMQVRKLIHEAGIQTFPKPKGIPDNYRVKLSNNGAGMKYVHPENEHTYIRVMPGKPHSLNPNQQNPYVNHRINGQSIDKFGRRVANDSPEAHIPIEEFVYRKNK